MSKKKYTKQILERRVVFYPRHKYHQLFIAYAHSSLLDKSKTGCEIIKGYFDAMKPEEREKLFQLYEKMTPEQRKNPGRLDFID